jgi:hypothetical protein
MVGKIVKKMLFSLSGSVALTEYSVSAEYSAEYTAETFGQSHFRSDTRCTPLYVDYIHSKNQRSRSTQLRVL